jgi:KTSC domain
MPRTDFPKIGFALVLSFSLLSFTACGSLPSLNGDSATTGSEPSQSAEEVGTNSQLISIQSDNVSAAGYDETSMVMTLKFDNGALYEYYGVTVDLWTSFLAAQPHPWSQVGYPRLVRGGVPFKRIG